MLLCIMRSPCSRAHRDVSHYRQPYKHCSSCAALTKVFLVSTTGHAKIDRLLFIADHSPPLQIDALKMAAAELKNTLNASKYASVMNKLHDALIARGEPSVGPDAAWIDNTGKKVRTLTEKLE